MRIALLSPFTSGPLRGNTITVQRIYQYLPTVGCDPLLISLDTVTLRQAQQLIDRFQPELLHAFHAYHSGPAARLLALRNRRPYLITMTGSDLYDPNFYNHPDTLLALQDAAAITCFDPLAAEELTRRHPELRARVQVIPQGVTPLAASEPFPRQPGSFIILLPVAIRPVKGVLEAFTALAPLADQNPQLQLWVAGGDLDADYAAQVRQQAAALPWVQLMGEVPHQRMGDLFAACDLVLNYSRFEGGMANTLLEAMASARPVIARDVAGNRSLIQQGETGWLFQDQQQLRQLLQHLLAHPKLLKEPGAAAKMLVTTRFSPQHEAASLAALYAKVMQAIEHLRV
jgi:glycosyltransferase involved in cell wall biosynthesis